MKRTTILAVLILAVFAFTLSGQRGRYTGKPSIVSAGRDVYFATKTVVKTVDLDDDTSTDDFQFDDDAGNSTAQNLDLGTLVPAWGEIVSAQVRCFESVGAGTFQVTLGTSSAGNQILPQTAVDTADEVIATAAGGSPEISGTSSALNIWLQGDPSGNWSAAGSAGRWIVSVTYIDYGAIYTAKNP